MSEEQIKAIAQLASQALGPILTAVGSFLIAWFTAWRTSRSEVLKTYRQKRIEAYDEIASFIDDLRTNPRLLFDQEFPTRRIRLENHLRTYGSRKVKETLGQLLEELGSRRIAHASEEADLKRKYMPEESCYDGDELLGYATHPIIDPCEYDSMLEELERRWIIGDRELLSLAEPVFDAMRESMMKAKD